MEPVVFTPAAWRFISRRLILRLGILPNDHARRLMDLCRRAERLEDAGDIARAASA